MPPYLRVAVIAWGTATFLLSHLYVPFVATLVFGAGLIVIALRPDTLRTARLVPSLAGAAIGASFVLLYLWEPIRIMVDTVYPGQRTNLPRGAAAQFISPRIPVPEFPLGQVDRALLE
jgi:hypothetical protein